MIKAVIHLGRVEPSEPLPEEWEGLTVQLVPLTPDDPIPDLEELLAAHEALGPMEYEPGEREEIAAALAEQRRYTLEKMRQREEASP